MPSRLLFIVEAMLLLMAGENLVTLLHAGDMHTMPRPLAEHTGGSGIARRPAYGAHALAVEQAG